MGPDGHVKETLCFLHLLEHYPVYTEQSDAEFQSELQVHFPDVKPALLTHLMQSESDGPVHPWHLLSHSPMYYAHVAPPHPGAQSTAQLAPSHLHPAAMASSRGIQLHACS